MPSAREAHSRSFLKAVSWRITGTLDTFIISFVVTGKATIAGSIAATELLRVGFESHEARAMRRTRSMTEAA
jgi:uncharacterized membrane protein